MAIQNYDVNQVTVTLVGPTVNHVITGFAKDTFFSLSMDEERIKYETDVHGNVIMCDNYNRTGKATVTLSQGSPSNSVLSRLDSQKDVTGINALFSIQIKDNNSDTLITSPAATVLSFNDLGFADSATNRAWSILLTQVSVFIGGING